LQSDSHRQHISGQFNAELEAVRNHLLEMGGRVEAAVARAVETLLARDSGEAEAVIAADEEVNAMEVRIDEECSRILARRQPAASDLRLVIAVAKVTTDLERVGDEATKIARQDVAMAVNVVVDDEGVDSEYHSAMRSLVTFMMEDPRSIGPILNELWALRALERIGDHAANIAEQVIYLARGLDVRHMEPAELRAYMQEEAGQPSPGDAAP
jgi:phosphate transport system protein